MFLDANIFIYAYLSTDKTGQACSRLISRIISGEQKATTSQLVLNEVLYFYFKKGMLERALEFYQNISSMQNIEILPVDRQISSHVIRFMKDGLAPSDAMHAAVMSANGVETICSYDRAFDKIKGIKRQEPK